MPFAWGPQSRYCLPLYRMGPRNSHRSVALGGCEAYCYSRILINATHRYGWAIQQQKAEARVRLLLSRINEASCFQMLHLSWCLWTRWQLYQSCQCSLFLRPRLSYWLLLGVYITASILLRGTAFCCHVQRILFIIRSVLAKLLFGFKAIRTIKDN